MCLYLEEEVLSLGPPRDLWDPQFILSSSEDHQQAAASAEATLSIP